MERRLALELHFTGLLLDGERKSEEPMAGRLVEDVRQREAVRQRLQQCVSVADWSDNEMRRRLALKLEADLPEVEALVVDDTGFPKKGVHSAGVARQDSGTVRREVVRNWGNFNSNLAPLRAPRGGVEGLASPQLHVAGLHSLPSSPGLKVGARCRGA